MTEKMEVEVDVKSGGKNVKNRFFKMHFMTTSKNVRQNFLSQINFKNKISYLGEKINILPKKMTDQMEVEVDAKNRQKSEKVQFLKCTFWPQNV